MNKDSEQLSEKLENIISEAEKITSKLTDPEMRRVAFDRVLEYLLQNSFSADLPKKTTQNEVKVKAKKTQPQSWVQKLGLKNL